MSQYRVLPGPEHFLPPAAASMGVYLPNPGEAHINGVIASEEKDSGWQGIVLGGRLLNLQLC